MASVSSSKISCGVYQLFDLYPTQTSFNKVEGNHNEGILLDLMTHYNKQANRQRRDRGYAQVVFSDAYQGRSCAGARFANFLRKRFEDTKIVELSGGISPSTRRRISTWVWTIPHNKFRADPLYPNIKRRLQSWERPTFPWNHF